MRFKWLFAYLIEKATDMIALLHIAMENITFIINKGSGCMTHFFFFDGFDYFESSLIF